MCAAGSGIGSSRCARAWRLGSLFRIGTGQSPFRVGLTKVGMPGASWNYDEWMFRRAYLFVPAQSIVGAFVKSFEEFPPRALPASFSVGDALKKISEHVHN